MLVLPDPLRLEISASMREAYPEEACGLLLGRIELGRVVVSAAIATRNVAPERRSERFEIDPQQQLAVHETARARGEEVVGVWHSHPDRGAEPSSSDLATAWEGWSYLIGRVSGGELRALRSWRLESGRFLEEAVTSS